MSLKVENDDDVSKELSKYDAVIMGSDQIWNSACIPEMGLYYFGVHSTNPHQILISYAASFGHKRFNTDAVTMDILRRHLTRFRAISVRENDGIELLKQKFGIDSIRVLDPTMLMTREYYLRLAGIDDENKYSTKDTLAYYLLDESPEKKNS